MSTDKKVNNENEHLLQNTWVLWFRPPGNSNPGSQAKQWESSQRESFKASSAEQFWQGYQKLPRIAHGHPINCDYSLFREGVKPMWEDEFNKNGGRWTYALEKRPSSSNQTLPSIIEQNWLDVMLTIIGEGFDPNGDMIAGGVCGIRPPRGSKGEAMSAKIHIWTKDASNTNRVMEIGKKLKEVLNAPDGQLAFAPHEYGGGGKRGNYSHGANLKL